MLFGELHVHLSLLIINIKELSTLNETKKNKIEIEKRKKTEIGNGMGRFAGVGK